MPLFVFIAFIGHVKLSPLVKPYVMTDELCRQQNAKQYNYEYLQAHKDLGSQNPNQLKSHATQTIKLESHLIHLLAFRLLKLHHFLNHLKLVFKALVFLFKHLGRSHSVSVRLMN